MKYLIFLLIAIVVIYYILVLPKSSFVVKGMPIVPETPKSLAVEITPEVYAIVQCESQWVETAKGDCDANGKCRAYGLAQFHRPTWDWLCELSGKDLDYYEPKDQIELLTWAVENNRSYLWTCARKLGI